MAAAGSGSGPGSGSGRSPVAAAVARPRPGPARFRGCLAGALLGDCLGAVFEGRSVVKLPDLLRFLRGLEPAPGPAGEGEPPGSARRGGRNGGEGPGPAPGGSPPRPPHTGQTPVVGSPGSLGVPQPCLGAGPRCCGAGVLPLVLGSPFLGLGSSL